MPGEDDLALEQGLQSLWLLLCTFLVVSMQLGFAMLEVGGVREAHRMTVLAKNVMDSVVTCLVFAGTVRFLHLSLVLGPDGHVMFEKELSNWAFSATCATICSGSMAERAHMVAYLVHAGVIGVLVYPILAEGAWGQDTNFFFHKELHGRFQKNVDYHDCAGSGVVGILSILPLLSEVKFGHLIAARDAKQKREGDRFPKIPPIGALCLLLVAELCSGAAFLNPSDKQARRAIGEVVRAQKNAEGGFEETVNGILRLLESKDVHELAKLLASVGGLAAMLCMSAMSGGDAGGVGIGIRAAVAPLRPLLTAHRFWGVLAVAALFVLGNWTALTTLVKKPAVWGCLANFGALARAVGFAAAAGVEDSGSLSTWAMLSAATCIARISRMIVHEQLAPAVWMASWWSKSRVSVEPLVLTTFCLEAWCLAVLLLILLRRPRKLVILLAVTYPCVALAQGAPASQPFEAFVVPALQRGPAVMAVTSALLIFMGGFPTMLCSLVLIQVLYFIHGLDNAKLCSLEWWVRGTGGQHAAGKASLQSELKVLSRDGVQVDNWARRYDDEARDKLEFQACSYLQVMGMFTLWVGWYGFNAGSVLGTNHHYEHAAALVSWNTTLAASAAGLGACLYLYGFHLNLDVGFLCNGVLSGMVAITASCDVATPAASAVIGLLSGLLVYPTCSRLMRWAQVDDPVDAVSVHAGWNA
ncbi:AMT1-4 [Symbiodinium natans]|uniref:AMT1-4 protein n=1 Tax=Symbiodinium natans TaxID=878477 RepID=A0A812NC14_9DINO|nr:AMT1-4 [Symbiodinium natans]